MDPVVDSKFPYSVSEHYGDNSRRSYSITTQSFNDNKNTVKYHT